MKTFQSKFLENPETVVFKTGRKYSFVNKNEINWIESTNGILKVHVDKKYYIAKLSLQRLKQKLSAENFIQISRSKMVNFHKIKELINSGKSNEFVVVLNDSTVLKWGRGYRDNFPELPLIK